MSRSAELHSAVNDYCQEKYSCSPGIIHVHAETNGSVQVDVEMGLVNRMFRTLTIKDYEEVIADERRDNRRAS